jgi:hypothetical protein
VIVLALICIDLVVGYALDNILSPITETASLATYSLGAVVYSFYDIPNELLHGRSVYG